MEDIIFGFVGAEVIIYKYKDKIYIESLSRMWNKLSKTKDFATSLNDITNEITMRNVSNDTLYVYDFRRNFVPVTKMTKGRSIELTKIITNTREVICTSNYMFATDSGKHVAKSLIQKDILPVCPSINLNIDNVDYTNDATAWLYGVLLSSYNNTGILDVKLEDKLFISTFKEYCSMVFGYGTNIDKVDNDSATLSIKENKSKFVSKYLKNMFNGKEYNCSIPSEVFYYDENAKLAFIAGLLDGQTGIDGIRAMNTTKDDKWCYHTIFKNVELGNQIIYLLQTLGIPAILDGDDYIKFIYDKRISEFAWSNPYRYKDTGFNKKVKLTPLDTIKSVETWNYCCDVYNITTSSKYMLVSGVHVYNNQI